MNRIKSTEKLTQLLKRVLMKQRIVLFSAGIITSLTAVILTSLLLSLLAKFIILPIAVKISALIIASLTTLYFFARFALWKISDGTIIQVALSLENKHKELKGRLVAAVQFFQTKQHQSYSTDLIELTFKQAFEKASVIDFNEAVTFNPILKTGKRFLVAALVAILMVVTSPGMFSHSFNVYSNPTEVIAPPIGYKVIPFPDSMEWVKYRDIEIGASIFGDELPENASIHYRLAGGSWQTIEIELKKIRKYEIELGDSLFISSTLRQINKSFDYYVKAGRLKTDIQKIDVVDRPRVNNIKLSIFYPDYTSLEPTIIDENNGSFSAVVGSRANMRIETNLPVEMASLVMSDSSRLPLKVDGKFAELSLIVDKSQGFYISLTDHLGENNPDPIEYYITAIEDEYPSIDVLRPGFDVNLSDDLLLPLKVRIFDDFGFSSLVLKYTVVSHRTRSDENVAVLHFSDKIKTEGEIEFNWDMDQLNLFPGDYAVYYFEVADNDKISGPKITKSRQYIARLPSLDEIISESEGQNAKRIINTEQIIKSGKELSERLKKVSRKLQAENIANRKTDWQQQKELENILDKNSDMVSKINKIAKEMDKSIDKMSDNSLMSREIIEKLQQIQKLFEEIATPEMKEAQKKLMEALKEMEQQKIEDALKDFEMSQKELMERLERTLALLKKMQLEQKMEAMLRKVEDLIKKQEEMNKNTEESDKNSLPILSEKENQIKKDLQNLKKELKELKDIQKQAQMESSSETNKFSEALEKTDAGQNMQKMSQALSDKKKNDASSQGKKAYSKLMQMMDKMQKQMQAMKGSNQEKIKAAMRKALDDANYLSKNQEDLLDESDNINPASLALKEIAKSQQDLMSSCNGLKNQISELGKESPFVAAELQSLVDEATKQMEMATTGFDSKKGYMATQHQREAMTKLNKTSIRLMESLQKQKQCNKGGSCDKPNQQLQSLCNKQNKLNQQTQNQCNKPSQSGQKESQKARQSLQRLAGEQQTIRKSMEQLNQEFGGSRQVLGRLDDIAKEMREIEETMAEGDISQELFDRQVKVYSRMLEASRSLYKKDFSNQRKANSAKTNAVFLPPELTNDILNDKTKLEDRLRRYLGENYPPQYEKQIKAYFKAILQIESETSIGNGQN